MQNHTHSKCAATVKIIVQIFIYSMAVVGSTCLAPILRHPVPPRWSHPPIHPGQSIFLLSRPNGSSIGVKHQRVNFPLGDFI